MSVCEGEKGNFFMHYAINYCLVSLVKFEKIMYQCLKLDASHNIIFQPTELKNLRNFL